VTSVTHSKKEIEMAKFMVRYVVLMLLIMGCATSLDDEKENWKKFDETSRAYLIAIRWGEYEAAYAFKRIPDANTEVPDFNDMRDIRVTSYRVKQTIISKDEMLVMQLVDIQYYRMRDVTVRTITDRQKWEYDKERERWYLLSDLPHFE
jgi:hypothetical protein